ncbi:hypothetical protein ACFLZX_03510 [Nanoarchaeota archaeon]
MENIVKKDIINTLQKVKKILDSENPDIAEIKELSNHTIHNASIYQDEDSVSVAILIYAISKIIERNENRQFEKNMASHIKNICDDLSKDNIGGYKHRVSQVFKEITKTESKIKRFIEEVIRQAQIKKGSKIFEHGISIARASEMLGLSQWELMFYVGKTSISDKTSDEERTQKRLAIARGLFK